MLCAFAPAQASESGGQKKEGAVVLDVPIPNLTLSLMVDDSRVVGRLELSLQVHATDATAAGKLEEMLPRIRDLLMTRITPTPIPGTSNLSAQTLTEMKSSILDLLHDVLGTNAVDAVYIVKAVTRRI